MSVRGDRIRVEVADGDDRLPRMRTGRSEGTGGRGLGIVDDVAHSWGSDSRGVGKAVWFELG